MMAKKHDPDQIGMWAKDWGISGYEAYDPKERERRRQYGVKQALKQQRKEQERKFNSQRKN